MIHLFRGIPKEDPHKSIRTVGYHPPSSISGAKAPESVGSAGEKGEGNGNRGSPLNRNREAVCWGIHD